MCILKRESNGRRWRRRQYSSGWSSWRAISSGTKATQGPVRPCAHDHWLSLTSWAANSCGFAAPFAARKPLQNSASPSWFRNPVTSDSLGYTNIIRGKHRGVWARRALARTQALGCLGVAIRVPTQPGGFLPGPARMPPFCLQDNRELWRAEP